MIRQLRYLGDPILRVKCKPIEKITQEILNIATDLVDTVTAYRGSGLAAPQIGYDVRMFVVCLTDSVDDDDNPYDVEPTVFINPKLTFISKDKVRRSEGCMSIPGIYEEIFRPREITVEALDIHGKPFTERGLKQWRSRCVQHEMDHINGILITDHFSKEAKEQHREQLQFIELRYKPTLFTGDPFRKN